MPRKTNQIGSTESPKPSSTSTTDWMRVIEQSLRWRKRKEDQFGWHRYIREYRGDWQHIQSTVTIPTLSINLVFAYVKTEIARLYFRDPHISVNPKRFSELGASRIAEAAINSVWRELNLKQEVKRALIDTIVVGHGWMKVGYSADIGLMESEPEIKEKRKAGRPRERESVKDVVVNEFIKSENVFAYHYPWKDVLFSPSSLRPPIDSRWMAFRSVKPLRSVKESGIYTNTKDLQPTAIGDLADFKDLDKHERSVILWEVWDKDFNRVQTFAEGHDKKLADIAWPYQLQGFPVSMFSFNELIGEAYPLSDVGTFEPQLVELIKMMAIMLNHLKRWNRQIFVPQGFMEDEEKMKFKQGIDGGIIEYAQGKDPGSLFVPPYAPVQNDIYAAWNLLMEIWKTVAGQSDVERGSPARSQTRTLGELELAVQGGKARSDEKLDSLESGIENVAKKLLSIMQQKLNLPKIVSLVGPRVIEKELLQQRPSVSQFGQESFTSDTAFTLGKIDIQGEFDVSVVAGSTVPLDKSNKLKAFSQMTQFAANLGIQPGSKASRELGREILREIDVKGLDRIMDVAEEEAQQQAQQPLPAEREAQAKIQADQSKLETQVKTAQAQGQAAQMSAQAGAAKSQQKIQQAVIDTVLAKVRAQQEINNGK